MRKYLAIALVLLAACNKDEYKDPPLNHDPIDAKGDILFISRRTPNSAAWTVYRMNADGTNQHALTAPFDDVSKLVPSHDSKKVLFVTRDFTTFSYSLVVMDVDGQNMRTLLSGETYCGNPVWSPDDSRIAFEKQESRTSTDQNIYTMNPDGSGLLQLTTANVNETPRYFPNGQAIVYTTSIGTQSGVYSMKPDGSSKRQLTPVAKSFRDPQVSASGKWIAVTSVDMNGSQLFVMNSAGSSMKQLTSTVAKDYNDVGFARGGNERPVWSPVTDKMAYVSYENNSPDIFVVNADGTGNKRLTDSPVIDDYPCWTNDGNYILFHSGRNQSLSQEIYIMRNLGELQTPLCNSVYEDIWPAFIAK